MCTYDGSNITHISGRMQKEPETVVRPGMVNWDPRLGAVGYFAMYALRWFLCAV